MSDRQPVPGVHENFAAAAEGTSSKPDQPSPGNRTITGETVSGEACDLPAPYSHLPPDVFSVHDGGNSITLHFAEIKSARTFRDTFPASIVAPAPEKHLRPPAGWKLVPVELTEEMIDGHLPRGSSEGTKSYIREIWHNLLSAAPSPISNVGGIVPPNCTGYSFVLDPGVMHVRKDGSGYIVVDENDFVLEDDRCEGPDGPEGSVHWIARMGASEITALRNFLNGAPQEHVVGEPVAWALFQDGKLVQATRSNGTANCWREERADVRPLYDHPAPRPYVATPNERFAAAIQDIRDRDAERGYPERTEKELRLAASEILMREDRDAGAPPPLTQVLGRDGVIPAHPDVDALRGLITEIRAGSPALTAHRRLLPFLEYLLSLLVSQIHAAELEPVAGVPSLPPANNVRLTKAEEIIRAVKALIVAERKHAALLGPLNEAGDVTTTSRDDIDIIHADLLASVTIEDCDAALKLVRRRTPPPTMITGEPDALELRYRAGFEDGEKHAYENQADFQSQAMTYKSSAEEFRRLAKHYMDALQAIIIADDLKEVHAVAGNALGSGPHQKGDQP